MQADEETLPFDSRLRGRVRKSRALLTSLRSAVGAAAQLVMVRECLYLM